MVRLVVFAGLMACIFTASCAPVKESVGSSTTDQHEVSFEIKDISWANTSNSVDWVYEGKGVLVTKDSLLQKGAALVFLEYNATPKSTFGTSDWSDASGVTTDGTGSISISIYYDKTRYKEDPGPPRLDWRTQGYLRMAPAHVTADP